MAHARISEALRALVLEPEAGVELDQVLDRFYAPDFTHRTDGEVLDRSAFAAMVAATRKQVAGGTVTVLDELSDGTAYAERHVFRITMADGSTQQREVAIFGTHAEDGRFRHLSETGFDVTTDETH
jgi:hypothetical protein